MSAAGLIFVAALVARDRESWLLAVEEPVVDWVLDGTDDVSRWEQAEFLSSPTLLVGGTILLIVLGLIFEWRIALAVVVTSIVGTVVAQFVQNAVNRQAPSPELATPSFPNLEVVQTGVFLGLVAMMLWWLKLPRLLWQIVVEVVVVVLLVVSVRLILSGQIWPSDALISALVVGFSLITAAIVFEANPAHAPWKRSRRNNAEPATGSTL